MDIPATALAIRRGDRLALARGLTQVENDTPAGRELLSLLFAEGGQAHLIGVTGAPGTGKSSLVNALAAFYRRTRQVKVGVVAVDPTSPFTGGALLGDRVRMRDLATDPGVFVRSMAARGALGGLAHTTAAVVQLMDAAGYEVILIETVGAGQSEVDIVRLAHTTLVIEAPGLGDDIQAIKAGILEIADILVVNKADQPGVENTERALMSMLEMEHHGFEGDPTHWIPPVLRSIASRNEGIEALAEAIQRHQIFLKNSGEWQRREAARLKSELHVLVQELLVQAWQEALPENAYQQTLEALLSRQTSPHQAAQDLLRYTHR